VCIGLTSQRPCKGFIYTQNHSLGAWGMGAGVINLLIPYDRHRLCLALRESSCSKLVKEESRGSLDTFDNHLLPILVY
jgi:hypothetical protein